MFRVRNEISGGAWCPKEHVSESVYEFLQIDFGEMKVITLVETQGRFLNGQVSYLKHLNITRLPLTYKSPTIYRVNSILVFFSSHLLEKLSFHVLLFAKVYSPGSLTITPRYLCFKLIIAQNPLRRSSFTFVFAIS